MAGQLDSLRARVLEALRKEWAEGRASGAPLNPAALTRVRAGLLGGEELSGLQEAKEGDPGASQFRSLLARILQVVEAWQLERGGLGAVGLREERSTAIKAAFADFEAEISEVEPEAANNASIRSKETVTVTGDPSHLNAGHDLEPQSDERISAGQLKGAGELLADLRRQREPESVGPYRILERLGEGGMGIISSCDSKA